MFPEHVGRMVLDSAIDPSLSITDYNRDQSQALEAQLMRFVDYCTASGDCPLPADHAAATQFSRTTSLVCRRPSPTRRWRIAPT